MTRGAVVEEHTSPGGKWKVAICRRADGTLRLQLLRWRVENVPEYDHFMAFWAPMPTAASITDSLDIARTLAHELLEHHAPEGE